METAAVVVAFVLAYAAVHSAPGVFVPLIAAFYAAVLAEPLVARFERAGLRRGAGAAASVAVLLAITASGMYALYQPFADLVSDFPQYEDKLREAARDLQVGALKLHRRTERLVPPAEPRVPKVQVVESPRELTVKLLAGLGSIAETAAAALFIPFLTLFLLLEKRRLLTAAEKLLGHAHFDRRYVELETSRMARAYFLGNLALAAAVGAVHWLTFVLLGFENAFALGLLSGALNVVPIVGLPAALIVPGAQALTQFEGRGPLIAAAIVMGVMHLGVLNWVEPRTIGARVRVNGFAATTAMLLLGWSWGAAGFLLAIPLAAQAKILLSARKSPWAELLEDA